MSATLGISPIIKRRPWWAADHLASGAIVRVRKPLRARLRRNQLREPTRHFSYKLGFERRATEVRFWGTTSLARTASYDAAPDPTAPVALRPRRSVKCPRIWLAVSWAPQRRPHKRTRPRWEFALGVRVPPSVPGQRPRAASGAL
jgi:hypothetical protein